MANEKKTEEIVRNHFRQYSNHITFEENQSENINIKKLLAKASKQKTGKNGYPEFIIQFKNCLNVLVVIECKPERTYHESEKRDSPALYAVDGVLWYSSFLSKEYDVISIAVSGTDVNNMRISHFLQLKGESVYKDIFGDKFLTIEDYLDGYLKTPEKTRQDYSAILDFSKVLNRDLHAHKIKESDRSLLLSAILIALDNEAFKLSYSRYTTSHDLANALVDNVITQLRNASIEHDKLENLKNQFSFIRTDTSLSMQDGVLKKIIDDIDKNINSFIRTHKYFDILGELYIEFLRYANSDKGLGIVLTPPHITELFTELAQVNKNSIVFDNCTGTGGFLISAMKKMIDDASGDSEKIQEIKTSQIIGIEYQSHIYALSVSNMYIHQDGKTNIINGSCFDSNIKTIVKSKKPTVGFLNPPYKSKNTDTEELKFVLSNLDVLTDGAKCLAIVPMKVALETKGVILDLKKEILSKHTLDAVFSMPDELFFNSKVSVVSCVMAFTAHKKHPTNKSTFFGYYKEDGFEKRKHKGRIDIKNKWHDIKEEWVHLYKEGIEKKGISVKKIVGPKDEWCAEAYMRTSYENLSLDNFISSIRKYLSFLIMEGKFELYNDFISNMVSKETILNTENWNTFRLSELFNVEKGKRLTKADMELGNTYFIGSSDSNNGITSKINKKPIFNENTITVNYDGSVGESFYQPMPYWALDSVNVLVPKFTLNSYIGLFITTIIKQEKYRYNYGRKWGKERMESSEIKLPTIDGKPDFNFMEDFIKSIDIWS